MQLIVTSNYSDHLPFKTGDDIMLRTDEGFIEVIYNLGAPQTERKTVVIFRAEARFHSLFNETTITIKGFVKNEAKQAWNWIEFNAS